jgi:hypothetical protein
VTNKGFWATLIGGGIGGAAGLVVGLVVGYMVAPEREGLEGLEVVFAVAAVGAWVGSVGGAYSALNLAKLGAVRATVGWLAILAPPLVGGGTWLAVSLTDADDFGSNFIPYLLFTLTVWATAYLARRFGTGKSDPFHRCR